MKVSINEIVTFIMLVAIYAGSFYLFFLTSPVKENPMILMYTIPVFIGAIVMDLKHHVLWRFLNDEY